MSLSSPTTMPRKVAVKDDVPPPCRSSRIQESAAQDKPPVPKKRKTTNAPVKKLVPTEKASSKASTTHKATTKAKKGKPTGRHVDCKIEVGTHPQNEHLRHGTRTYLRSQSKRDALPVAQELVDMIVNELKGDNATLKSCRLVSQSFSAQTRTGRFLFPRIVICKTPNKAAMKSLLSSNVTPHVRELVLCEAVFIFSLRSSDFGNLNKLYIMSNIWSKLRNNDNGVLSLPSLTELELRGVRFPGVRRALMFILSFPKLEKLALDGVRIESKIKFEYEEKDELLQMIGGPTPVLRWLWIGNIAGSNKNPGFCLFYDILVEVATSTDSLEGLYLHRYERGLELVRTSTSLRQLNIHLAREPPAHIEAVPLCHIPIVHVGFDVCKIGYSEMDEEAELSIQWLTECLEIEVDHHTLEHLDVRCTVKNVPERIYSLKSEMLDDLDAMLQQERFSSLKQFSVTTAWEDYEDKPSSNRFLKPAVSRVQKLHEEIVKLTKVVEKRCDSRSDTHDRHDQDWPLVLHQYIDSQWFAKTRMSLGPPPIEEVEQSE